MRVLTFISFVVTPIAAKAYAGSILHNFPAFPSLPTAIPTTILRNGLSVFTNATESGDGALDLNAIQGDILIGMRKDKELFTFFHINAPSSFKKKLQNNVAPLLCSVAALTTTNPTCPVLITFGLSQSGLTALGITETLGDSAFSGGQFNDAVNLGDPGTGNWVEAFKGTNINGVFTIASDSWAKVNNTKNQLVKIFGSDVTFVYDLKGLVRPGNEAGHEHFGYMDGISQPAVKGFTKTPAPGQIVVDPGLFLFGEEGDSQANSRPAWAKDGTIMAFRQLKQLVPEFNKFVADRAAENKMSPDLLGARMMGRWKSGAPIDLTPLQDDPVLALDPLRNNNFDFSHPGSDILTDQTKCPFTAHIRKTAPRADFSPINTQNHILRSGIPYGPEVSAMETARHTTTQERGLAFVSYQTSLDLGFRFIQRQWANAPNFFFGKNITNPGADPIIGSLDISTVVAPRGVVGLVPSDASKVITFPIQHIVSRGGEYFFIPSINAIKNGFSN